MKNNIYDYIIVFTSVLLIYLFHNAVSSWNYIALRMAEELMNNEFKIYERKWSLTNLIGLYCAIIRLESTENGLRVF
jgi:hypothetical protein